MICGVTGEDSLEVMLVDNSNRKKSTRMIPQSCAFFGRYAIILEQNIGDLNMKDKVKCLECNQEFGVITSQHLKSCCGLTIKQYKEKYPDAETISEKVKETRKQNCKNMIGQTKTVQCSKCSKEMETSITNHWNFICDKCRESETYPGKIYLKDKDLVVCQICFQAFEQISWMHTKIHGITLKEYREKFPKAWVTNKGIREERRKRHTGLNNPAKRKDVRRKMSKSQKFSSIDYINKYPWIFPEIEKIRDYLGVIEIQCKNCKKWFHPNASQLQERIRALCYGSDGQYLYCSNECKGVCPLYRLNPLQYLSTPNTSKNYTESEYQVFREEVLKRQRDQYDYNFCEICEDINNLHVHHEKPQKTHPIMSLDPDNGIVLCRDCHFKKAHIDSCSTVNLANLICSDEK